MKKYMLIFLMALVFLGCSGKNMEGSMPQVSQQTPQTENLLNIDPAMAEKYGIPLTREELDSFASSVASAINSEDANVVRRAESIARSAPGERSIHQLQLVFLDVHDFWKMEDGKLSKPRNAAELIIRHTGTSAEYSVLVSSLFKSLKFETRIVLACNERCVMYPEVYIGKEKDAEIFLNYLSRKYGEVYYHLDSDGSCWIVVDNVGDHVGSKPSETNAVLFIYPDGKWKLPSELATELVKT